MKTWVAFVGILSKFSLILLICINLIACQNSETAETKQEQLNNNSSGMDQDHTAAPPDTLETPGIRNSDTSQLANPTPNASADSVQQKF